MPSVYQREVWAWDWLRLRRRHGLTQRTLAALLGVCRNTVWNVERGRKQGQPVYVPRRPRAKMMDRYRQLKHKLEREQPEFPWEE